MNIPRSRSLLILEDDDLLRRAVGRLLQSRTGEPLELVLASTIEEAQQAVLAGGIDGVLSDVVLTPGFGTDFHRWLQQERPDLAAGLVFMTGGCPAHVQTQLNLVGNPVVAKPFQVGEIMRALGLEVRQAAPN